MAVKATVKKEIAPKTTIKAESKAAATEKKVVAAAKATKTAAKATKTAAKTPAKKTTAKKSAAKAEVIIEVADRQYTVGELEKIANDVWVYDLDKKASELKSVKIYADPVQSRAFCVFNDDIKADFFI